MGKIVINRMVKLVTPVTPMLLRGYVDHPISKVVLSNLVCTSVRQFRPDDAKTNLVSKAMLDASMLEAVSSLNIEGMIDGVLEDLEIPGFTDTSKPKKAEKAEKAKKAKKVSKVLTAK